MDASLFATFNCWSFLANQLVQHEDLLSRQTHRNCATSWFGTMPMWWHCKELRRQQISWENCLNATNAKWTQPLDTCASNRNQNIAHPLATQQPSLTDRARTHEQHQDFLVNTNDAPRLSRSFIHSKLKPYKHQKTKKKMCDGRSTPNQTLGIIFPSDAWTPCNWLTNAQYNRWWKSTSSNCEHALTFFTLIQNFPTLAWFCATPGHGAQFWQMVEDNEVKIDDNEQNDKQNGAVQTVDLERIAWMQQTQNGQNHLTPARRTKTRTLHTRWQRNNPHSPTALALTNNTKTSWSTPTTPRDSRAHSFTPNLNRISTKKPRKKCATADRRQIKHWESFSRLTRGRLAIDWQMLNTIAGENRHRPTVSTR